MYLGMQCGTVAVRVDEMAKDVCGIASDVAQTTQEKTRSLTMGSCTKRHVLYCTQPSEHIAKQCEALYLGRLPALRHLLREPDLVS